MANAETLKLTNGDLAVYVNSYVEKMEVAPCLPGVKVEVYFGTFGEIIRRPFAGIPHVTPVRGPIVDLRVVSANIIDQGNIGIRPLYYSNGFLRVEEDNGIFQCYGDEKLEQQLVAAGLGIRFRNRGSIMKFLPSK
ncbi:MAG: hypothetical protein PHQ59_01025 [Candidatus Daviesbacteria bacterium]|nr:hypothetical protein [Candidatus Daviesbacteria bacterium]